MDVFFSSNSNGLNFYPLYVNNNNIAVLLDGTNSAFSLKKEDNGLSITITTSYTLQRSITNYPGFIYNSSDISDDSDVADLDNDTTAYVLFFIFAYGVDEYGSSIFSRPSMLGVLQLPNAS